VRQQAARQQATQRQQRGLLLLVQALEARLLQQLSKGLLHAR
jgi:hypothetical protein